MPGVPEERNSVMKHDLFIMNFTSPIILDMALINMAILTFSGRKVSFSVQTDL